MATIHQAGQTHEQIMAELMALRAENQQLRAAKPNNGIKISEKGAVSVYGFGRFPVTLFLSQWEKLFERIDEIKAFIEANRSKLSVKPSKSEG